MPNPLLVSAEQIDKWSNSAESSHLLPELVQRLLIETDASVDATFRTNSGVRFAGWDGQSISQKKIGPIPSGSSCWEVSVKKQVTQKANSDYETRTQTVPPSERRKNHFIFVTTRKWSCRDTWALEKRSLNQWKSVKALDAESIYSWLLACRLTHLWPTEQIVGPLTGIELLESNWERVANSTDPALTTELVLTDREAARDALRIAVRDRKPNIAIRASSFDEESLFMFASLHTDTTDSAALSCLLVSDFGMLEPLAVGKEKLVVIATSDTALDQKFLQDRQCTIVRVLLPGEPYIEDEIELHLQSKYKLTDKFVAMGFAFDDAQRLGHALRKGLLYFRKECAIDKASIIPSWRNYNNSNMLLAVALIQEWRIDSEIELGLVARISNLTVGEVEQELAKLKVAADSCIREIGGIAYCISPVVVFDEMAASLTSSFIKRFFEASADVLYTPNPLAELNEQSSLVAQLKGVEPEISERITKGILNGLALLAVYAEKGRNDFSWQINSQCYAIVSRVLTDLGEEPIGIRRVSSWLTLLAEISPTAFAEYFSNFSEFDDSAVEQWFQAAEGSLFFSPLRTEFLFALETVAWAPEFFLRSVQILARLCRFKIQDNWRNSPFNSLVSIFLYWYPCTSATLEQRVSALEWIHGYDSTLAIKLLEMAVPFERSATVPTAKPKYRLWYEGDRSSRSADAEQAWRKMSALLFDWSLSSIPGNLHLVERARVLSTEQLKCALDRLEELAGMDVVAAVSVYNKLYEIVAEHRAHYGADWNMGQDRVLLIEECVGKIEALIGLHRYRRLFKPWVPLNRAVASLENHHEVVAKMRSEAVLEIRTERGVDGFWELAEDVESPYHLGIAIFDAGCSVPDIIESLTDSTRSKLLLVEGMLWRAGRSSDCGPLLELLKDMNVSLEVKCIVLESLADRSDFFEMLASQGSDVIEAYWLSVKRPRAGSDEELVATMS